MMNPCLVLNTKDQCSPPSNAPAAVPAKCQRRVARVKDASSATHTPRRTTPYTEMAVAWPARQEGH